MGKRLSVDQLEPVARAATRNALEKYDAPECFREAQNLTLGTLIEDDVLTFELYIAGAKPSDARVLATTRVSRITGAVLDVEVHLPSSRQTPNGS